MKSLILSAALDTNGQNARYAKASERWGTDPGVLKALAIGHYDPASVVGRFQAAPSDTLAIRAVHRATHMYQQMPVDIEWTRANEPMIRQLAEEADVLHLNNSWRPWQKLRIAHRKPFLLHHHGSLFRSQPKEMLRWARANHAIQAVSTVDLMRSSPELLHWLPTAYDVDWLVAFGKEHRREPDGLIRVVSAPTNREFKATAQLEAAVGQLQAEGMPIELVLIEGRPWAECMALKATADIYFDQVALGYGCNAVEAWGMGIPVIAGADEWTIQKMVEVYAGPLPFYSATVDTIKQAITDLATSKALRTKWAKIGMAHTRTFHDELPALTKLAALYRMAIDVSDESVPLTVMMEPVSFTAAVPQIHTAGHYVTFPYTTTNPYMASALRLLAQRKPRFGIQEVA